MATVGYVRASGPGDGDLALQLDALRQCQCTEIFRDQGPAARPERPGLLAALDYVERGDVVVIWRLDRLARSLTHLVGIVNDLQARGVGFRSLTESIDTTGAEGAVAARLFTGLAEFERDLLRERTRAGRNAAIVGRLVGRKPVITPEKLKIAKALIADGMTVREAATHIRVSKTALYNALNISDRVTTAPAKHKLQAAE